MKPSEIFEYFQSRQASMVDAMREIVEIESPSYDFSRSLKIASWIEQNTERIPLDLKLERMFVDGCGEHLLLRAFASDRRQTLILGHTDTVHPVGTRLKNPTRVKDDKLYGCGIFDMKANIVMMLGVLNFFAVTNMKPAAPITILLSCDEEVGSKTGRVFVEREARKSAKCLVLEPSFDGKVKTGRKGTGMFTLKAHGIPAHAGLEPEKGASAILELARQIEKIHALNDPANGTTANVCTAKGGTTTNVIPEHAECEIDVRFTTLAEAKRIESEIRNLQPVNSKVSLQVLGDINRPPMERTAAVATLYETAKSLAASFDYELGETQVGGASDGNFVAALGIPVLDGLGIAGSGAHTLDEHIFINDIAKRAALVTMLLRDG